MLRGDKKVQIQSLTKISVLAQAKIVYQKSLLYTTKCTQFDKFTSNSDTRQNHTEIVLFDGEGEGLTIKSKPLDALGRRILASVLS